MNTMLVLHIRIAVPVYQKLKLPLTYSSGTGVSRSPTRIRREAKSHESFCLKFLFFLPAVTTTPLYYSRKQGSNFLAIVAS